MSRGGLSFGGGCTTFNFFAGRTGGSSGDDDRSLSARDGTCGRWKPRSFSLLPSTSSTRLFLSERADVVFALLAAIPFTLFPLCSCSSPSLSSLSSLSPRSMALAFPFPFPFPPLPPPDGAELNLDRKLVGPASIAASSESSSSTEGMCFFLSSEAITKLVAAPLGMGVPRSALGSPFFARGFGSFFVVTFLALGSSIGVRSISISFLTSSGRWPAGRRRGTSSKSSRWAPRVMASWTGGQRNQVVQGEVK